MLPTWIDTKNYCSYLKLFKKILGCLNKNNNSVWAYNICKSKMHDSNIIKARRGKTEISQGSFTVHEVVKYKLESRL